MIFKLASKITKSSDTRFLNFANIVALVSVVVGCIALIMSLSILDGFDTKLHDTARKFTSDICVQTINATELYDVANKMQILKSIDGITVIHPVMQTEGIVSTPKYTEGIALQSIDLADGNKNFVENIVSGKQHFTSDTAQEIILSTTLASKLDVKLGDNIMIYAIKDNDHISFSSATYSQFKIAALYNTGMQQYDNSVVFFPFNTLAKFLDKGGDCATYLEVKVSNLDDVDAIAKNIDETLGYPIFSLTYYDINRSIFAWIELQKQPIPIVLAIISIVASLNILTMLIITVVEKTHTIGILRTMGMQGSDIVKMFAMLSLRIAAIGAAIGIALSVAFTFLQNAFAIIKLDSKIYFVDSLPINMHWEYIVGVAVLTITFALIAAIVPAIIAVRITPIRAIRFR
ncbi:MAG: FtsX-like permease family protein [Ignavibacteria bacterium]|jgi:lipoprotein-releasing system permease protein|nr:FtsX-like permease family protein [Ignavibacteria bacterium]